MNSTIVSKVDRADDGYRLRRCDVSEFFFARPVPSDLAHFQIIKRIESIEELQKIIKFTIHPVNIELSQNDDELSINNDTISIGRNVLMQDGALEKAILVIQYLNGNPIAAHAIADFIWGIAMTKPQHAVHYPWYQHVRSIALYCKSTDRLLIHNEYCVAHNELEDGLIGQDYNGPSSWSMKSFYSQLLYDVYQKASLSDKYLMLRNLIFLAEPEDVFIETLNRDKSLDVAEAQITLMAADWIKPISLSNKEIIVDTLKSRMMERRPIDTYMVISRSSRNFFPFGGSDHVLPNPDHPLAVEFGRDVYFYPSDVGFRLDRSAAIKMMKPQKFVMVSCQIPSPDDFAQWSQYTKKIMFVKVCDETDLDWDTLAAIGVDQYIESDKSLQFIEFDIEAIMFAKKMRGPLKNHGELLSWKKWLLWQGTMGAEPFKIKRPMAVIEGVKRFRYN